MMTPMDIVPFLLLAAFNVLQLLVNRTLERRLNRLEKTHLTLSEYHIRLQGLVMTQALAHKELREATHKLANLVHEKDFPDDGMGKVVN